MSIGVPYARADVDSRGPFVTCPECGDQFYSDDIANRHCDDESLYEDAVTKTAAMRYAKHYQAAHEGVAA